MRYIFKPALVLFLICIITTGALAVTYSVTKDIIAERNEAEASSIRSEVLSEAETFEKINDIPDTASDVYKGVRGNEVKGFVITTESKGYGGNIIIMTGISTDGIVKGVKILTAEETPGLGSRILEYNFLSQFTGTIPKSGFKVVKTASKDEDIEAITSATVSSNAVVNAVNKALETYRIIMEKGGNVSGE